MNTNRCRVLLCPLNWGLGHATRSIPIIREFISQNAEVIIAGEGDSLELLKQEFPALTFTELKVRTISYPNNSNMTAHLLKFLPVILRNIYSEHRQLKKIKQDFNIDIVISDNRYGCWNKSCYSIFITHQINIQCPKHLKWLQPLLNKINHLFIRRYNECWIPDQKELPGLSGILSHGDYYLPNIHYLGPLSRFTTKAETHDNVIFDLLVILSGPEPQRTIFEKKIIDQLKKISIKTLFVRGLPAETSLPEVPTTISIVNHLETSLLKFHIQHSKYILCRPGYSTIMDLAVLGRKAIVVPTPGQTEQEYLAGFFHLQKNHFMQMQSQFDLSLALKGLEFCEALKYDQDYNLLKENVGRILKRLNPG